MTSTIDAAELDRWVREVLDSCVLKSSSVTSWLGNAGLAESWGFTTGAIVRVDGGLPFGQWRSTAHFLDDIVK